MEQTILIIEDDVDMREALAEALKMKGYNVITSDNSEAGLAIVQKMKPDLLLLDLFTYSIHGVHFLERLRSDASVKDTKVIVITNIDNESHQKRALELGVMEYFIKANTSLSQIAAAVDRTLKS